MKYTNKLQKAVFDYFNTRKDFYFHGYTGSFWFKSWKKGEDKEVVHSTKPHGNKDTVSTTISIFTNKYPENEKYGVELQIEMYMWGYQSEEIVFQGWVENIEQLKIICNAVGI